MLLRLAVATLIAVILAEVLLLLVVRQRPGLLLLLVQMNRPPAQEGWPHFAAMYGRTWRARWKLGTWLVCGASAYYLVFHSEFKGELGERNHVFTGLRAWHTRQVDKFFGIEDNKGLNQEQHKDKG